MPIYEYECKDCGRMFEQFLGVNDPPITACAHCNSPNIRKLISNCTFHLKGSGWYVTDYAKKDSSNGNGAKKASQKEDSSDKAETKEPASADKASSSEKKEKSSTSAEAKTAGQAA